MSVESQQTVVAWEQLSSHHMIATIDTHTNKTTAGSSIFCAVRARLYDKDQKRLGVRQLPACEDVSPKEEECPLLEDVTKQSSENRD
jgi:hypothetical protein